MGKKTGDRQGGLVMEGSDAMVWESRCDAMEMISGRSLGDFAIAMCSYEAPSLEVAFEECTGYRVPQVASDKLALRHEGVAVLLVVVDRNARRHESA